MGEYMPDVKEVEKGNKEGKEARGGLLPRFGKGVKNTVLHPVDTAKNIGKEIKRFFWTGEKYEKDENKEKDDVKQPTELQSAGNPVEKGNTLLDQNAYSDFLDRFLDDIERGYSRTGNPKDALLFRQTICSPDNKILEGIKNPSPSMLTPLEEINPRYRVKMISVRENLAEKLQKNEQIKLSRDELDVIITTILNYEERRDARDAFLTYIIETGKTLRNPDEVGKFVGSVLYQLTTSSTTRDKPPEEAKFARKLMDHKLASNHLEKITRPIVENAVNELKDQLKGKLAPLFTPKAYRYLEMQIVYSFLQAVFSDQKTIEDPNSIESKMWKEYAPDVKPITEKIEKMVDKVRAFSGFSQIDATELEKLLEKSESEKIEKEIEAIVTADEKTKTELLQIIENIGKLYERKLGILNSEEYKKILKKTYALGEEGEKARNEELPSFKINELDPIDADLDKLKDKLKNLSFKKHVGVEIAKDVIEKLKKREVDMYGITEDQFIIATIVYEGGMSKIREIEDSIEIKAPRKWWIRFKEFWAKGVKGWVNLEGLKKHEKKYIRAIGTVLEVGANAVLFPIKLSWNIAKFILWDLKFKDTQLGIFKKIWINLKNAKEVVYTENKKPLTKRGWIATAQIAGTLTALLCFIPEWRNQIHIKPQHWKKYELAYPNFKASPFAENGKGWSILNQQQEERRTPVKENYLVSALLRGDKTEETSELILWSFYADVNRNNVRERLEKLKGQLEWLQEHPDVIKFFTERRFLMEVGKVEEPINLEKYKESEDDIKTKGWKIKLNYQDKKIVGYKLERDGFTNISANKEKFVAKKIEDNLKLNKVKTEEFVKLLIWREEKKNIKIDKNYLEKNWREWVKKYYLIPRDVEGYMNIGIRKQENIEFLLANPAVVEWLKPKITRGMDPFYINPGEVENIVEKIQAEIRTRQKVASITPILPSDETAKDIFAAVLKMAQDKNKVEDVKSEYATNKARKKLMEVLGDNCPASDELKDYVMGKVDVIDMNNKQKQTSPTPPSQQEKVEVAQITLETGGEYKITFEHTDIFDVLLSFNSSTATKKIVPGRVDDFVKELKEYNEEYNGNIKEDFNAANGKMLNWAEKKGYLMNGIKTVSSESIEAHAENIDLSKFPFIEGVLDELFDEMQKPQGKNKGKDKGKDKGKNMQKENVRMIDENTKQKVKTYIAGLINKAKEEMKEKGMSKTAEDLGIRFDESGDVYTTDATKIKTTVEDYLEKLPASAPAPIVSEQKTVQPDNNQKTFVTKLAGGVEIRKDEKEKYYAKFSNEEKMYPIEVTPLEVREKIKQMSNYTIYNGTMTMTKVKEGETERPVYKIKVKNDGGYFGRAYDAYLTIDSIKEKGNIRLIKEERIK